mgnify:CR=1 FL=1
MWQPGEVAYGGALLDGLACGIPAVAVAGDAARQIVADGETGRIVAADPALLPLAKILADELQAAARDAPPVRPFAAALPGVAMANWTRPPSRSIDSGP